MNKPLLEVRSLHTYLHPDKQGEVKAVVDVSFSIPQGETFCLVGESGSGKSITALTVIRLLPHGLASHPKGEILFNGQEDLLTVSEGRLRSIRGSQIAMIFQEPMTSLNPVLTIGEQVTEALLLHKVNISNVDAKETAREKLNLVEISPAKHFDSYPHQLSGGERQRVMIAMALACDPKLLIADEPTTALDVTVQAKILKLLRQLQHSHGMSILFITHDFGVVAQMAQQVGVMQKGKLVEVGHTQQVLRNPHDSYTQKLLAAVPENLAKTRVPLSNLPSQVEPPLIQIRNLKVKFPIKKGFFRHIVDHIPAVDDVSLDIPRGQIVGLVGESGCGKTTLGRAILQLEKLTSGSIRFDGQELTELNARQLRTNWRPKMQMVFQDPQSSLNPRLLIETTLTEPLKAHAMKENHEKRIECAEQILKNMQLHQPREALAKYPHEFSGGERQRISLARALILNPQFIVCDEITSALDVSVQAEILKLLMKICKNNGGDLTLLFITHNISVVEYLSDWIVVMYKGKIVEQGPTSQICANPREEYTQELLAAVPRLSFTHAL